MPPGHRAPAPRGTTVPSPADAAIFRAQLRAGSGRARDRHSRARAQSLTQYLSSLCCDNRAAGTGHHKDPNWGVPASGYNGLGFSHDMQEIFGFERSSSTDSRAAILSRKAPSCSRWRLSHPAQHPPPRIQHCKCTDPSSSLSSCQEGNPRQGGQAAQEPGCHQLAFGGSWFPQAPPPHVTLTVAASWGY